MAVTITIPEVKENRVASGLPDAVLAGFIAAANKADNCLDTNNVTDDIQRVLKLNVVWHLAELSVRASVQSESSPTGASRSYKDGEGFQSTPYGQVIQSLDEFNCIRNAIRPPGNTLMFFAVGVPGSQSRNRNNLV